MKNISPVPALDVSHLTVYYRDTPVLIDCSVAIPSGVMVGILGPNGAGKTTFIKSVLGLIVKKAGTVTIAGVTGSAIHNKVAYVSQRSSVDWDFPLTVFDMVLMGCYGKLGWFKRPGQNEYNETYEALDALGLRDLADSSIGSLSGGQQQRLFLARALLQDAQVYFLDEPFVGIDNVTEKIIMRLFRRLRDEGRTIIVVHHDLLTAPFYFDWAILLNKHIIAQGPIKEVLTAENLDCLYGSPVMTRAWDTLYKRDEAL